MQHYLRGEHGLDYDDLAGLLPPELYKDESSGWERTTVTSPDRISAATALDPNSQTKQPPPMKRPTPTTPLLNDSLRTVEFHAYHERRPPPLPLVCVNGSSFYTAHFTHNRSSIAHEISRAIYRFRKYSCMDIVGPAMHNGMQQL